MTLSTDIRADGRRRCVFKFSRRGYAAVPYGFFLGTSEEPIPALGSFTHERDAHTVNLALPVEQRQPCIWYVDTETRSFRSSDPYNPGLWEWSFNTPLRDEEWVLVP